MGLEEIPARLISLTPTCSQLLRKDPCHHHWNTHSVTESRAEESPKKNTAWHLCQQSSDLLSHPLLATTLLLRYAELQIFKLCSYCNHVLRSPKRKINLNPTFVETLTISKDKSKMSSKIRIINTHCAHFSLEILSNDTDMVLSGLSTVTGAVFLKRD